MGKILRVKKVRLINRLSSQVFLLMLDVYKNDPGNQFPDLQIETFLELS